MEWSGRCFFDPLFLYEFLAVLLARCGGGGVEFLEFVAEFLGGSRWSFGRVRFQLGSKREQLAVSMGAAEIKEAARELRQGESDDRCCIPALAGLACSQSVVPGDKRTIDGNCADDNFFVSIGLHSPRMRA